jgi:hypothetical protein
MVTIQRSGAADTGNIFTKTGHNRTTNTKFTFFNGVAWNDVADEDMWFQVWTDSLKASDGMGVDAGSGMFISKTTTDSSTGASIDYCYDHISFNNNGQNVLNNTVAQATTELIDEVQDQRTGNPVFSRQITKAALSNVSTSSLSTLMSTSDPVVLGGAIDANNRSSVNITGTIATVGLAIGNLFQVVNPGANLLSTSLIGSKLTPNIANPTEVYRVVDAILCVDGYGDVNGDGYIGGDDVVRAQQLVGESLFYETTLDKIRSGIIDPIELMRADVNGDGYITMADVSLISNYVNHIINSFPAGYSFNRLCLYVEHNVGRNDEYYDCDDPTKIRNSPYGSTTTPISSISDVQLFYYGRPDPVEIENDPAILARPYVPVVYNILFDNDYWLGELILASYVARQLPCTFTYTSNPEVPSCSAPIGSFYCEGRLPNPSYPGGRNDWFVPGNLVMGQGQIVDTAGAPFSVDMEVGSIILEVPEIAYTDGAIDIFNTFVAESSLGTGLTSGNYPAMRFSDCSTVKADAIANHQVMFTIAIASYSPSLDGLSILDGYGIIVDPIIGINMLNATGVLHFRVANLIADPTAPNLRTRIQVTVYLKKAGWKNQPVVVDYTAFSGLVI